MDDRDPQDGGSSLETTMREILAALTRIEARLGSASSGPQEPRAAAAAGDTEVQRLLLAGRKIPAIRAMRAKTGAGLTEAKAAVDDLERNLVGAGRIRPVVRKPLPWGLIALVLGAIVVGVIAIGTWNATHAP